MNGLAVDAMLRAVPRARLGHVPALDGIRGLAIAAVIALHYFRLPGGFYGVDLFFVLSGFLITTLLLEEHERSRTVVLGGFYKRRARRLLPALAVLLLAVGLLGSAIYPPRTLGVLIGAGALYSANFVRLIGHRDLLGGTPVTQLWSLAQEEQFYLLWPPILVLLLRRRLSDRSMTIALAILFIALLAYRGGMAWSGSDWHRLYYGPDTHADGLVIGCLAAFLRRARYRLPPWGGPVALAILIAAFVTGKQTVGWELLGLPLVELAAATAILAAVVPSRLASLLSFRPLAYLGVISYSLYLWQDFALWVTGWHHPWPALSVALVLTLLSYYVIERPFRRGHASRKQRESRETTPGPVAAQQAN